MDRIYDVVARLSGINKDEVEEALGKLKNAPEDGSGSS